jgi:hypothetical protein
MEAGSWNWLEVARLSAGLLTPVAVGFLGVYLNRVSKRFEMRQWQSQKLTEKRLAIYDELAPTFNDLLCFFTYVGSWRDINPPVVVSWKRVIDKKVNLASPLFSPEFHAACNALIAACYKTFNAWGQDPKLKTQFSRRKEHRAEWNAEWEDCFAPNDAIDPRAVQDAYRNVMQIFARDIGVNPEFVLPKSSNIPGGIR